MTDLVVVPQPGDPLARPSNHPKENTVITDPMIDAYVRAHDAVWQADAPTSQGEAVATHRRAVRAGLEAALDTMQRTDLAREVARHQRALRDRIRPKAQP